ncbi:alpha/beta hydrolase [Streptomyces sp. CB01881]|uniref:alpha/beta hydrolase n=1 Tax=Streptomyces sp. CB01881 TaxID=2078691 RepID=UPI000CDCC795|nr:alpha/beta hydrolase [Streptomyces sp. CB01881]AUY53454.1 esterase [Streptomyces sp. CB01881]TYC69603.1 alpha/beta hydrolase [Streptomyces sp. CB01881]
MSDPTPVPHRRPVLDRALQEFLDTRVGRLATELPDLSFLATDDVPEGVPGADADDPYGTTAHWHTLPCGPTGRVRVQVTRPAGAAGPSPVVLFLPGLGWSPGDAACYGRLVREFALGTDSAVVYVDYARAPTARYPVAVEQCHAVARWIHLHGHRIGLAGERMAAVGDSAGANLVAALTLLARQRGDVPLVHQVLLCPVTDADFDTPSYRRFATGYFLHRDHMRRFWDDYLPERRRRGEATAAPLRASLEQLAGLPPALVVTAEADVLRDEGEAYAARLREAGVPVVAMRYQGAVHGFLLLDALCPTGTARAALIQAVDTVHVALHRRSW